MKITEKEIGTACDHYGAAAVYAAAYRWMAGDHGALPKVGLINIATLGEADRVGVIAYRLLDPSERAADLADVTINLAKLHG